MKGNLARAVFTFYPIEFTFQIRERVSPKNMPFFVFRFHRFFTTQNASKPFCWTNVSIVGPRTPSRIWHSFIKKLGHS